MAKTHALEVTTRDASAKKSLRAGQVPAVLYGHGIKAQSVAVNGRQFTKVLKAAGFSSLVSLKFADGKDHTVIVRDIQTHPLKGTITHADFYQVRMDEAIEAKVPLRFTGEAHAVKDLGGVLVRNTDEVEISALPADLPHDIEVDISVLRDFDAVIRVGDLKLPKGVTLLQSPDSVIALVQEPRSEQELEQLSEAVTEDVEAVEGVKPEEPAPAEGEAAKPEAPAAPEEKKEKAKE